MIQNKCKIIGLTGGIASGKSTVSHILRKKGYRIIDADIIAREVVQLGQPAYKEIVDFFGKSILNKDKTINRKKLGRLVFSDKQLLKKLNKISHPYIYKSIKDHIKKYSKDNKILFLDIALLIEELDKIKDHNILFDEIWLVYVDRETQLKRLIERNNYTIEEAKQRIESQMPLEEKLSQASRIIDNRQDKQGLEKDVEKLLKEL